MSKRKRPPLGLPEQMGGASPAGITKAFRNLRRLACQAGVATKIAERKKDIAPLGALRHRFDFYP